MNPFQVPNRIDFIKLKFMQFQSLPPNSYEQMAETSVMMGRSHEAETILLHNNKITEAIQLCVRMHRWERALDIAKSQKSQKSDLNWVLKQREKYLKALGRDEYIESYTKINSME